MKAIHYIATDSMKYVDLAARSAASFKKFLPGAHTILYSDLSHPGFDEVVPIANLTPGGHTDAEFCEGRRYFTGKIGILGNTKHDLNLYLDCDTEAVAPVDIFSILNRFDMAAAHAPRRLNRYSAELPIPKSFPDFNLGILLFRRNQAFFRRWRSNYDDHPRPHDQTAFRLTAWESDVRIAVLPPEYNRRPASFDAGQETVILHG